MLTKGDFHIHSTASDGHLSPSEIIISAKERAVDTISITDHNTMDGIEETIDAGKKYGVSVIPGLELSTRYNGEGIHLLGYFKDNSYNDATFLKALSFIRAHKIKKARNILSDFITLNSSEDYLSVLEGIYLLRTFGASVVLAHPIRISKRNLREVLSLPFDGIEAKYCFSSCCDTAYFMTIALICFSFYTAGSDFHTNKRKDTRHSNIGEPYLNSLEIQRFLKKSGILPLKS